MAKNTTLSSLKYSAIIVCIEYEQNNQNFQHSDIYVTIHDEPSVKSLVIFSIMD